MVSVTRREVVGITAVRITSYDPDRTSLIVQNAHASNDLFIDSSPLITTITGLEIKPGATLRINSKAGGIASLEFYAIASGASTPVNVGEFRGIDGEKTDVAIDTGADVTLDSEGTPGTPIPASGILVAGTDGTNLEPLKVENATNPNLRVKLYDGSIAISNGQINADAVTETTRVLSTGSYNYGYNGVTWDRLRSEQTGIPLMVEQGPSTTATSPDIAITTTPVVLATLSCKKVWLRNIGATNIRIGDASITATRGMQVLPGETIILKCANANQFYHRTETGTGTLAVMHQN